MQTTDGQYLSSLSTGMVAKEPQRIPGGFPTLVMKPDPACPLRRGRTPDSKLSQSGIKKDHFEAVLQMASDLHTTMWNRSIELSIIYVDHRHALLTAIYCRRKSAKMDKTRMAMASSSACLGRGILDTDGAGFVFVCA